MEIPSSLPQYIARTRTANLINSEENKLNNLFDFNEPFIDEGMLANTLDITKKSLESLNSTVQKFKISPYPGDVIEAIELCLGSLYNNTSQITEILQIDLSKIDDDKNKQTIILSNNIKPKIINLLKALGAVMIFTSKDLKSNQYPYNLISVNLRQYFNDLKLIQKIFNKQYIQYTETKQLTKSQQNRKDLQNTKREIKSLDNPATIFPSKKAQSTILEQALEISVHKLKIIYPAKNSSEEIPNQRTNSCDIFQKTIDSISSQSLPPIDTEIIDDKIKLLSSWIFDSNLKNSEKNIEKPKHTFNAKELSTLKLVYKRLYLGLQEVAKAEDIQTHEIADRVLNIMLLFCPSNIEFSDKDIAMTISNNVNKFIVDKAKNLPRPFHDLFMYKISTVRYPIIWKSLVNQTGITALEAITYDSSPSFANIAITSTKKDLEFMISKCLYNNDDASPELKNMASFCKKVKVTPYEYTRMAEIETQLKTTRKTEDLLPNKIIYDATTGLILVKLPAYGLIALILGHIVKCCQTVLGHSEKCVIDGLKLSHNGFYVLLKPSKKISKQLRNLYDIDQAKLNNILADADFEAMIREEDCEVIAQFYGWLTKPNNLDQNKTTYNFVADSIEAHPRYQNEDGKAEITAMFNTFATELVDEDSNIMSVMVGKGGGTRSAFNTNELKIVHDTMFEGYMYGDASDQYVVAQKLELKQQIQSIKLIHNNNIIVSAQQLASYQAFAKEFNNITIKERVFMEAILNFPSITMETWNQLFELYSGSEEVGQYKNNALFKQIRDKLNLSVGSTILLSHILVFTMPHVLKTIQKYNIESGFQVPYKKLALIDKADDYENNLALINKLITLDIEILEILLSDSAKTCYKCQVTKISDMIELITKLNLPKEKIALLLNSDSEDAYRLGKGSITDLANLEIEHIQLLTSEYALTYYLTDSITMPELKDISWDKLKLILSKDTQEFCYENFVKIRELVALPLERIQILITQVGAKCYNHGRGQISTLANIDNEKFLLLTSENALAVYNSTRKDMDYYLSGRTPMGDLAKMTVSEIQSLFSMPVKNKTRTSKENSKCLIM